MSPGPKRERGAFHLSLALRGLIHAGPRIACRYENPFSHPTRRDERRDHDAEGELARVGTGPTFLASRWDGRINGDVHLTVCNSVLDYAIGKGNVSPRYHYNVSPPLEFKPC